MLLLSSYAFAADPAVPELNSQLFHMSVDGGVGFGLDDADRLPNRTPQARVLLHYVNDPLVYAYESGERVAVVSDLLAVDLLAGYTLGRFRLGLELPVYVVTAGDLTEGRFSFGDIALDGKVGLLDPASAPVGLALTGRLLLPTGSAAVPVGAPGLGGEISVAASKRIDAWRLALNVGTRQLPTTTLEDFDYGSQLTFRAGVGRELTDSAGASLEVSGASVYGSFFSGPASTPVEVMLSGWYRAQPGVLAHLGVGTGLTRGIGAPAARLVAGLAFGPEANRDRDGDGITDDDDTCPEEPEDVDTFQDADGCPDPDNDGDGIADAADTCPADAEDRDGFQDTEGCPDPDNDGDGIADTADGCPDAAEDVDGWQDTDGCPDPKTEVRVHFVDEAGKPVLGVVSSIGPVAGGTDLVATVGAGKQSLKATVDGYFPFAEEVTVPDGPPLDMTRVLKAEPDVGTLEVRVQTTDGKPIEATLEISGGQTLPLTGGSGALKLKSGKHEAHIEAKGFASTTQVVSLSKGRTQTIVVVLQPAKVVVQKEKIEILDKIYFDTNKATIRKQSYPLLKEIASVFKDNPDILKVRVEGHTDSRGDDAANLKLSDARARAVRDFLVKEGIDAARLDAAGFGETRPVDPAENEAAWDQNRRVEFVILDRKPAE